MTQVSYFWTGSVDGDATLSPYSALLYTQLWRKLFTGNQANEGILDNHLNELIATGISGGIKVDTGAALVNGGFYESTSSKSFAIATPSASVRVDTLVLRRSWANQEIRLAILAGVEGAGVPVGVTQNEGILWEYVLAFIVITAAGAITVVDRRKLVQTTLSGPNAMQHIETLSGGSSGFGSTINFTDIPQTFRHLLLTGILSNTQDAFAPEASFMLNGDISNIFNRQTLFVDNASQNDQAFAEINNNVFGTMIAPGGASGRPAPFSIRIPFYTNTNFFKTLHPLNGALYNDTLNNFTISSEAAVWKKTEAINRITIISETAGAEVGIAASAQASLYGII